MLPFSMMTKLFWCCRVQEGEQADTEGQGDKVTSRDYIYMHLLAC